MGFDGFRDWMVLIATIALATVVVLSFLGINLPNITMILGSILVFAGFSALLDSFTIGYDVGAARIFSILFSAIITLLGINMLYTLPFVGNLIGLLPIAAPGLTNYIFNGVIIAFLLYDMFMSE